MGAAERRRRDGSAFASCRAGGLWPERGKPRWSVLARLAAASSLMGVQLGFMGVQLGGKVTWAGSRAFGAGRELPGTRGRMSPRPPDNGAPRCGCSSPALACSIHSRLTAIAISQVRHSDYSYDPTAPPLLARGMPARTALGVLAWSGDGSPVWGCTTTSGDQVPPRTLFRKLLSTGIYRCDPASIPNGVW